MTPARLPTVSPLAVGDDLLLDVREHDEWRAGHAPQAVHVPLGELLARLDELPRDRPIAIVCRVGSRSGQATEYLAADGWQVRNVAGGMSAWAAAGLPMQAETTAAPRVL